MAPDPCGARRHPGPVEAVTPPGLACLGGLLLGLLGPAQAAGTPDLNLHGERVPSACAPAPWQQLAGELQRLARDQAPAQLQALVQALLCESGPAAARQLVAAAPRRLTLDAVGTGESPSRLRVDAAEALQPLAGRAWNATLAREGAAMHLQWQADEACVRTATLSPRAGRWAFTRLASACD